MNKVWDNHDFTLISLSYEAFIGALTLRPCMMIFRCTGSTPGGVSGDPQFSGFLGQQYQIHGVDGLVYNIISDPILQFNARFTFLEKGTCPVVKGKRVKEG